MSPLRGWQRWHSRAFEAKPCGVVLQIFRCHAAGTSWLSGFEANQMTIDNRDRNRALVHFVVLPFVFLTVVLLGGLRINAEANAFVFIAPPLVTFLLAILLMMLFVRGRLIEVHRWISIQQSPLMNISNAWMLITIFFASAQALNSVLPERGLLHWLFAFFFLWTLWNNQFSPFDARRLLRSLAVLFGTAFVLKHLLLAGLYSSDGGWLKRLAGVFLQGVSLGTLDAPTFAPATGYISFFTLVLYVAGLILLSFSTENEVEATHDQVDDQTQISSADRLALSEETHVKKVHS
jgi:hypothetical protein